MGLYGFSAEFRRVEPVLTGARHGTSAILQVEGRAGEGKSTLLMAIAMAALERGFAVASSGDRPVLSLADRALTELPNTFEMLPVLGDEAGLPRLRSWLAAQRSVRESGQDRPLLVALDDVHDLSPASVKVLATLPTQHAQDRVVWVLSRRVGRGSAEVQRLFCAGSQGVIRIRLAAMSADDTVALVREILSTQPPPELLALAHLAGGNRLLVAELVRGLIEEYGPAALRDPAQLRDVRLPRRLRNAVDLLLYSVSPRCRNMLQVVALCGGDLPLPRVAELLQEPIGGLVPLIQEAVDAGVVTSNSADLTFAQELTRRILATEIPSTVARELVREAGQAAPPAPGRNGRVTAGERRDDRPAAGARGPEGPAGSSRARPLDRTSPAATTSGHRHRLTEAERAIARLVGAGLTNQQIARRLELSPHTVNYHLRKIFHRLAIHSRAELASLVEQGY